jgi:hypothetical protein
MTYSAQAKQRFFRLLEAYKEALRNHKGIVEASLAIHSSLADVPKKYRRYVTKAFNG